MAIARFTSAVRGCLAAIILCPEVCADYTTGFEQPTFIGTPTGVGLNGQDGFYNPVPASSISLEVFTYASNGLDLPPHPGGGTQFVGGTGPGGGLFVRSQRDISYGPGRWRMSFDLVVAFGGNLPAQNNIGSVSTSVFPSEATVIALARWTDPATATHWNADYLWFDQDGNQLTEPVRHAGFQNLQTSHWYRWSTIFDFQTNRVEQVSITDLGTGETLSHRPFGRFLSGGGSPPPLPTGFRLFVGAAGNTLGFDNLSIVRLGGSCQSAEPVALNTSHERSEHGGWFEFVAESDATAVLTCGSDYDTVLEVYDDEGCQNQTASNDDCSAGTFGAGSDPGASCYDPDPGSVERDSCLCLSTEPGRTYRVRVRSFGGGPPPPGSTTVLSVQSRTACVGAGACCLPGDECVVIAPQDCADQGGEYQGDGASCATEFYTVESCGSLLEDISITGTEALNASNADDAGDVVPLGFPFGFFGDEHDLIGISSNGYLTFGLNLNRFGNVPIPSATEPNSAIFPLWDDLVPAEGGSVHYQTVGTAPNRRFIAQWTDVPQFANTDMNTFQAVLFEGTDVIEFRYGNFTPEGFAGDYTIGVENHAGLAGTAVDASTVAPGDCLRFIPGDAPPCCPADTNGDAMVDVVDLVTVILNWGCTDPPGPCVGDVNGDGVINVLDLVDVILAWGPC